MFIGGVPYNFMGWDAYDADADPDGGCRK